MLKYLLYHKLLGFRLIISTNFEKADLTTTYHKLFTGNFSMFLNTYETIYILKPDVTEDKNLDLVHEYKTLIKRHGGKNVFVQHRGRRHLSYNITHYYDGIYVQMNFEGNGSLVHLLEKSMRFNEKIIRYLTTRQEILPQLEV
jgi:small subunit ribosomal protein S6